MAPFRSLLKTIVLAVVLVGHVESTPAQVSCGGLLTSDTILTQDLDCPADGLRIGADRVTLDCGGHEIRGAGTFPSAGVLASGVSGVSIRNCRISGFRISIQAENAADLRVAGCILPGVSGAIRCTGCARARIEGNQFEGHLTQVALYDSPDARIIGNEMRPYSKGGGSFILRSSPRARIAGNRAPYGGAGSLLDRCDDSVIEDNDFAGNATIWLYQSDRCRIAGNTLVRGATAQPFGGGYVSVNGSSDCVITGNRIEGNLGIFLAAGPPSSENPNGGADRNVVEDNLISDSGYGLLLFGASDNRISGNRIERTEIGLVIWGLVDPESDFDAPSDRNIVEANTIQGGLYGVVTWDSSGNRFHGNEILDHWLGLYEGPVGPFAASPNEYTENVIAGNRLFGLLVIGGSPLLERNEFRENGSSDPAPVDLEPYSTLLGELRGGIALIPMVGDFYAFDNADPDDDSLARPVIGGPAGKNTFSDSVGADIYSLDTRAANSASLERDNHYRGEGSPRIRQDWFGLVRVEDAEGRPVAEAEVEVRDADGEIVLLMTTGSSGLAPESADPGRSQGLSPFEEGGPVDPWPRLTEYIVDDRGRRHELTPHAIAVDASGETGCTAFTWDGVSEGGGGSTSEDGRYQVAVVQLGASCETMALPAIFLRR